MGIKKTLLPVPAKFVILLVIIMLQMSLATIKAEGGGGAIWPTGYVKSTDKDKNSMQNEIKLLHMKLKAAEEVLEEEIP